MEFTAHPTGIDPQQKRYCEINSIVPPKPEPYSSSLENSLSSLPLNNPPHYYAISSFKEGRKRSYIGNLYKSEEAVKKVYAHLKKTHPDEDHQLHKGWLIGDINKWNKAEGLLKRLSTGELSVEDLPDELQTK